VNADRRITELTHWLVSLGYANVQLSSASSDASTRRYFRFSDGQKQLIAVDTPVPQDEQQSFITIAQALRAAGLQAPQIHHHDFANGWMLVEDFGSTTFADAVDAETPEHTTLYEHALGLNAKIIGSESLDALRDTLPDYSAAMIEREIKVFIEWCLIAELGLELSHAEQTVLHGLTTLLTDSFLEQPQVFTHRDFHGRNIMQLPNGTLGIIDFQGAVRGPISYDWVSLLRDCYFALPDAQVQKLLEQQHTVASQNGLYQADLSTVQRWFDMTGLQRHLKAIGIFCRLKHQDQKPSYMRDIPRTLAYVQNVCARYEALQPLHNLLESNRVYARLC